MVEEGFKCVLEMMEKAAAFDSPFYARSARSVCCVGRPLLSGSASEGWAAQGACKAGQGAQVSSTPTFAPLTRSRNNRRCWTASILSGHLLPLLDSGIHLLIPLFPGTPALHPRRWHRPRIGFWLLATNTLSLEMGKPFRRACCSPSVRSREVALVIQSRPSSCHG